MSRARPEIVLMRNAAASGASVTPGGKGPGVGGATDRATTTPKGARLGPGFATVLRSGPGCRRADQIGQLQQMVIDDAQFCQMRHGIEQIGIVAPG